MPTSFIPTSADLMRLSPDLLLTAGGALMMVLEPLTGAARKARMAVIAAVLMAAAIVLSLLAYIDPGSSFSGMLVVDGFSTFFRVLFYGCGLLTVLASVDYFKRERGEESGEYYALLVFSLVGQSLMASANELVLLFIGLEISSISGYIMAGYVRDDRRNNESALKYFLLGSFSTGFIVYGIALIFGATGTTSLSGIVASSPSLLLTIGAALLLIGFGFKVAAVPFHMWTPDVYQGSPSAVTAFMSSGAKIAGFAALLRVFTLAFPNLSADLTDVLWALSALTMIVGNFTAISQTNIKRMLAYSSIAHAGYILMAFVSFGNKDVVATSVAAGLFYLFAYVLANFGAWSVVIALEKSEGKGLEISDYMGLAKKYPALAAAMTVFMLSLIGFPPTLGLVGKFYLFRAAIAGGYTGLAIIGALTSLVSAYYYLRVVVNMYMREGDPTIERESWLDITTAVTAVATVALSFVPQWLFLLATTAVLRLF
jgi:NADH-quinone oxidoreductase subunit N